MMKKIHNLLKQNPEIINDLGEELYIKITEIMQAEVEEITKKDCIDYKY